MPAPNVSTTTSKSISASQNKNAMRVAFVLQKKLGGYISVSRFPLAGGRVGFSFSRDGVNYEGFGQSHFETDIAGTARQIYDRWFIREKPAIHGKVRKRNADTEE